MNAEIIITLDSGEEIKKEIDLIWEDWSEQRTEMIEFVVYQQLIAIEEQYKEERRQKKAKEVKKSVAKSKREQKLDDEFERMDIKPHVYHIPKQKIDEMIRDADFRWDSRSQKRSQRNVEIEKRYPFLINGITIVTTKQVTWSIMCAFVESNTNALSSEGDGCNMASKLIERLQNRNHIYGGVAVCDFSDQYHKRQGRIKAKGRLIQQLKGNKKEQKE